MSVAGCEEVVDSTGGVVDVESVVRDWVLAGKELVSCAKEGVGRIVDRKRSRLDLAHRHELLGRREAILRIGKGRKGSR